MSETYCLGCTLQRQQIQSCHRVTARKRHLRFGRAARSTSPHHNGGLDFTRRSLHRSSKAERIVTSACLNLLNTMVIYGRSAYKNRHARNSSWPGALISNQRPNTLTQTNFFRPQLFSCSRATDHTLCLLRSVRRGEGGV